MRTSRVTITVVFYMVLATSALAQSAQSALSTASLWGAIAFTADGSFSTVWKSPSKPEAEAHVLKGCAKFGRGACEVVAFTGDKCAALVHYQGSHSGKRFRISHTGHGPTSPAAQQAAQANCKANRNVRGQCQLRTVVCGDGR